MSKARKPKTKAEKSESIKLRQIRQRRYKANVKVGIKVFYLSADRDLIQRFLRQNAPERLPSRVGDNTNEELQQAFAGYMQEEWLGAWSDVFEYGDRHARLPKAVWAVTCTMTVNAIVIPAT